MIALLAIPACLSATTISETIKDGTGAVIPDARIEIRGGDLAQAVIVTTDGVGHFVAPDLKTGTYSLRVTAEGFAQLEQSVQVGKDPVNLALNLSLPVAQQAISCGP